MRYVTLLLLGVFLSGTTLAQGGLVRTKRASPEEIKAVVDELHRNAQANSHAHPNAGIIRQNQMNPEAMKAAVSDANFFDLWKKIKSGELVERNKEIIEGDKSTYGQKALEFAKAPDYETPLQPLNKYKFFPFREFGEFGENSRNSYWKIHVTSDPARANLVARLVVPILLHFKTHFKIIETHDFVNRFEADSTQRGKFITIYPKSYKETKFLIENLEKLFQEAEKNKEFEALKHPPLPLLGDAQVGSSGFVFLRYGSHKNKMVTVVAPDSKRMSKPNVRLGDYREFPFHEFVWHLQGQAIGNDKILFEGIPLVWIFPGTNYKINLNNIRDRHHSWSEIIHSLNSPAFKHQHVKNKEEFERTLSLLEHSVAQNQQISGN